MRPLLLLLLLLLPACATLPEPPAPDRPDGPSWTAQTDADRRAQTFRLTWDEPLAQLDTLDITLGGMSGLDVARDGTLYLLTDRGPNLEAAARAGRPAKRFAAPGYAPRVLRMQLDGDRLVELRSAPLALPSGRAPTGLPPTSSERAEIETALGPDFAPLASDRWGLDAEGVAVDGIDLWIADEYRPSLWRVSREDLTVRERFTPSPNDTLDRPLPAVVAGRVPNRGFEGVAVLDGLVYAILQSPMQPAEGDPATPFVRVLRLDPLTGSAAVLAYPLDGAGGKAGDLAASPDGRLLVLEHGSVDSTDPSTWVGHVYAVDLSAARVLAGDQMPERYRSVLEAEAAGVPVLAKTRVLDLVERGWPRAQRKPEGLAVLPDGRLAIASDNDYGLDAPAADGVAVPTGLETLLMLFEVDGL